MNILFWVLGRRLRVLRIKDGAETFRICIKNPLPVSGFRFAGVKRFAFNRRNVAEKLVGHVLWRIFSNMDYRRIGHSIRS
jgi:hypothetical protein